MKEKTVGDAARYRRSVRIYDTEKPIDAKIVKKCVEQAVLSPSSSNMQLWEFYHIISSEKLKQVAEACFNQPAARTAQQLVVTVVRKDLWRERIKDNVENLKIGFSKQKNSNPKREKGALNYYQKTVFSIYTKSLRFLDIFKYWIVNIKGISKPTYREIRKSDVRVIAHKSAALASQSFMLSMAGFSYDTCPMEGFDSARIKKILNIPQNTEISMVIGCGIRKPEGVYGDRFRIPFEKVYFEK